MLQMNKKVQKKVQRSLALLHNHEPSVKVSQKPTSIVYIANSGVVCGVDYETLEKCISEISDEFELYVFGNKPYTFVKFCNETVAENLLKSWQGQRPSSFPAENVLLYMAYVENLPESCCLNNEVNSLPKDLVLLEGFISVDEENELLHLAEELLHYGSSEVYHFGYTFIYGDNKPDLIGPPAKHIPECCRKIIDKILSAKLTDNILDQLTINIYEPGQGIPLHTDTHSAFESEIISLSLLSEVTMDFVHPESGNVTYVNLPPRSLLVMKGESRYVWKHRISPRKYDTSKNGRLIKRQKRVSFTFRTVRRTPCECEFVQYCDWSRNRQENQTLCKSSESDSSSFNPVEVENKFVYDVYDQIAEHFDKTRHSQWLGVKNFLNTLCTGSTLFDVGCGNGKYLHSDDKNLIKFGCDRSFGLCEICSRKNYSVFVANCLNIPILDNRLDAVLSIAVIHHLSSEERRRKAVEEIVRILKPGGSALIYVWAFEQKRKGEESFYLKSGGNVKINEEDSSAVSSNLSFVNHNESDQKDLSVLPVHENRTNFKSQDTLVPWDLQQKNNSKSEHGASGKTEKEQERFLRFYHVFKEHELERLCESIKNCHVTKSFYEQGNWCVIIEKSF